MTFEGFPHSSVDKESARNARDHVSILGSGRCAGEGKGYPLPCSGLENPMDCIAHGVTKSGTRLSDFHRHMLVHDCGASLVAQLVKNLHTVGDLGSIPELERFPWKRAWQPTPVFWPGESHGLYSPWGHKEWDKPERVSRGTCLFMTAGLPL